AEVSEPTLAWRATIAGLEEGAVEEVPPPANLALPLRPYQLDGFRWLAFLWRQGLGGILAHDLGHGKPAPPLALSAQTVSRSSRSDAVGAAYRDVRAPFLVVAPTSVASNWVSEAARFTPGLRFATVTATEAKRRG